MNDVHTVCETLHFSDITKLIKKIELNESDTVEYQPMFVTLCFRISVNLREVKEIRPGKNSKDFDKWQDEVKRIDGNLCFILYYGQEFRLSTLSLVGKTPKIECI